MKKRLLSLAHGLSFAIPGNGFSIGYSYILASNVSTVGTHWPPAVILIIVFSSGICLFVYAVAFAANEP